MKKNHSQLIDLLLSFNKNLPRFPDGRIDYSNSDIAAVITIFVIYGDQMLILKRSENVRTYKGKWNTVAGYLDNPNQTLKEKALEELREELKITEKQIKRIEAGRSYRFTDEKTQQTWIVFPVKALLKKKPVILLDWEHTTYQWIETSEIERFDTVPNLKKSLSIVL